MTESLARLSREYTDNVKVTVIALLALLAAGGCRSKSASGQRGQAPAQGLAWRPVGSWSGHGNLQTSSFESSSGQLRVRWKTTNPTQPGGGVFQLSAHSAISGRVL